MKPSGRSKPVIGVVGGIGAGKSTVAAELARLGCAVIDADRIGHELLGVAAVRREIRRWWGARVFGEDGQVDRAALGRIVFAEPKQLAGLDGIMHPRIRRRIRQGIAKARRATGVWGVVVDAAVLFEAGWDDLCTHRLFVKAPAGARARRVARSRGWNRIAWRARELSQISLDNKRRRCEYTVDNSSSASHLREQVRRFFQRISEAVDRP